MTLRKKGSRLITIDEVVYRWRVHGGVRCCIACAWGRSGFAVQRVDQMGPVLLAATSAFPVVPSIVEAGVRTALDQGWQSTGAGPAFRLRELV
ncbi:MULTISPECIES: hypothetical protein [unclassified Kitasatospora]|uniref:hypothetical protein n=1 Tax=unclassified Kitasatospora TaxID=2633591 RepID=UPI0034169383